ncbi:hypothetical protein F2P81_005988 [Scophthalmus maximus]|uniref:Uncharacterized protein n=1 Tax=Scophthalmus maximus TaxID=52904 RepID=A0A6A4T4J6_SCOMX|nr:hypothetical protein F2P81_005988 [Scophthalmus maximus]
MQISADTGNALNALKQRHAVSKIHLYRVTEVDSNESSTVLTLTIENLSRHWDLCHAKDKCAILSERFRKHWIAFLPVFTNMQEPLSKPAFKAIFNYNYSQRGTNQREEEEDTIFSWEMVLNMIEERFRKHWIAFLPVFTNMQEPLSKPAFKAIFNYNYSQRGTNQREEEEDTIFSWEMVLNMIEEGSLKEQPECSPHRGTDLTLDGNPYRHLAPTKEVNTVKAVLSVLQLM